MSDVLDTKTNLNSLPKNLSMLRTGTASDGRALFHVGNGSNQASALRDLRSRAPAGWTIAMHRNGVDAILTSDEGALR